MEKNAPKVPLLNILSIIVGSGIIVFGANILYNDFSKPSINIRIYVDDGSSANVTIINTGFKTAKNIRVTMFTKPLGKIDIANSNLIGPTDEQIKIINTTKPQMMIATFNRSVIGDNSTVFSIKFKEFNEDHIRLIVHVNHDDGSSELDAFVGHESYSIISSSYPTKDLSNIIIIYGITIVIQFLFIRGKKWIIEPIYIVNRYRLLMSEKRKINKIIKNICQNPFFRGNLLDWHELDILKMGKILSYNDLRLFNELLAEEQRRKNYLLKYPVIDRALKAYNDEYKYLAVQILNNINWKYYNKIRFLNLLKYTMSWLIIMVVFILTVNFYNLYK